MGLLAGGGVVADADVCRSFRAGGGGGAELIRSFRDGRAGGVEVSVRENAAVLVQIPVGLTVVIPPMLPSDGALLTGRMRGASPA